MVNERRDYFDSIPFKIQQHIVSKFLFNDIVDHNIFRPFFRVGREFDANFIYEISFGFTPRQYKNSADDRYMFEEEGDVSEVIFIMSGEWAVAYNSYVKPQDIRSIVLFDDMKAPEDMSALGYVIA